MCNESKTAASFVPEELLMPADAKHGVDGVDGVERINSISRRRNCKNNYKRWLKMRQCLGKR